VERVYFRRAIPITPPAARLLMGIARPKWGALHPSYGPLGGNVGAGHRAELHALHLLQQPELIEIDRAHSGLGAGSRLLLRELGVLLLVRAAEVFGRALLRLAAHDLVARLGRAVGKRARVGKPV